MLRLIGQLEDLYALTFERAEDLQRVCWSASPSSAELSSARLGLMAASTKRSKFLRERVYPLLMASSAAKIRELDKDLSDKRVKTSEHITRWSLVAIQADWPGYRTAVDRILKGVESRIAMEKAIILPALYAIDKAQAGRLDGVA